MIWFIIKWAAYILLLSIAYIAFMPLVHLLRLKIRYGKDIEIYYFPILGLIKYLGQGINTHKDVIYYKRKAIQKNPGVKIIATHFFSDISYILVDPQLIKQFLTNHDQYKKDEFVLFGDLLWDEGLLFTHGKRWRYQRKLIGQQFTFENLKCILHKPQHYQARIPVMKEITKRVFQEEIKENEEIKLIDTCGQITGEVVSETFFGPEFMKLRINGKKPTEILPDLMFEVFMISFTGLWTNIRNKFLKMRMSTTPNYLLTKTEKNIRTKIEVFREQLINVIRKRMIDFEEYEKAGNNDFLQLYIADYRNAKEDNVTFEEIIHQFITFFFAGMDTTSNFAMMACYALSRDMDLQERVRTNIKEHVKNFDNLDHSDLSKMEILNAFISEALRLYCPVEGIFPRRVSQAHMIGQGKFLIPKNVQVNIGIYPLMVSSDYFEEPNRFDIDRWLGKSQLKDIFSYIPFSAGGRNCIGQHMALMESKIMIIYLLLNYKLLPDPKRQLVKVYKSLYQPEDDRLVYFQKY